VIKLVLYTAFVGLITKLKKLQMFEGKKSKEIAVSKNRLGQKKSHHTFLSSPGFVRVVESSIFRCVGKLSLISKIRKPYRLLVGKSLGKL
jgi:hypothetical protein